MIDYDPPSHSFTDIDPDWLRRCREAYPHVKLEQAMKQAALWLDADWPKRKKKKWERFSLVLGIVSFTLAALNILRII